MAPRMPISVTYDLEDHRGRPGQQPRYEAMTDRLLVELDALGVRATVFVVGELAQRSPELIRRIHDAGHEIGLHGWRHIPFGDVGPQRLSVELQRGKELLEQLISGPVSGVRAPIFSLTRNTSWAVDGIHEAGFSYSSSVLPASNPQFGWAGAPKGPFRWPNGLIELPCPVMNFGPLEVPALGGAYVRYVPKPILAAWVRRLTPTAGAWTYLHPYDFDDEEEFFVLPWAGWLASRIVFGRRRVALPRLQLLVALAGGPGPQLRELAAENAHRPVFAASGLTPAGD